MTSISTRTTAGSTRPTESNLGAEDVLVQPDWLAEHLNDAQVRIIEIDVADTAYNGGHIDGAAFWNIYRDLKDPEYRTVEHAAIRRLIERSGVDEHTTVIFYGYAPAMGFWFMKLLGHADVRILDCSRESWKQSGRPWTAVPANTVPTGDASSYPVRPPHDAIRADAATVRDALHGPDRLIADVRTELEFAGERFWPSGGMDPAGRAGHIPSSVNLPLQDLYEPDGAFRGRAELAELCAALEPATGGEVITYCTIGGRACTAWFILSYLLGLPAVRVYDGSWAEWGRLAGSAVETGLPPTPVGRQ